MKIKFALFRFDIPIHEVSHLRFINSQSELKFLL